MADSERPLRIGLVLSASTGGIGRHVASVASRLQGRGHDVRIFCPPATATAHDFGTVVVQPLGRLYRSRGFDVLHAHGYKAGAAALPHARATRTALVVTWHNAVLGQGPITNAARLLQTAVARGADLTLGASSDLVVRARELGAGRVELAPVAAPALAKPHRTRAEQRELLDATAGDIVVLTVSRLAPQKNLGLMLDVARALRSRADLRFVVVGDGPLLGELSRRAVDDGSRVRFLGRQDDIASLLGAADLALLTSTWEARALVAQEALLAGVPLVSTRVGGIAELVQEAALLVEPGDSDSAVRHVLALADDPGLREALRTAGLAQAATWPDEDQVSDALVATYRRLLSER